ncbi:MAG TPA: bifunctional diaminohydroxyphosphoribosylaminopyrimidine deaminase/5-amino-6-(5-phosphoribosylamino)uracil reductase RibD [Candidatus Saccharimonadales bacterium]|nr:bifunctional diaminohydroxyphosphoribosylaminopyrimidine deaminase/5-amino-6-(5-phosphoribosylamino)uracil reductase RibD [Candidatus Saccharimonadales bacterium]
MSEPILTNLMRQACAEARKGLGATLPNPSVGAIALDANGDVLAVAATCGLHAEARLIETCRTQELLPRIHTMCVTLEPCNHQGRTPPCTEAIINAGIKRVVIGTRDPNPYVKGGGIERLREAGIEVVSGVNEDECKQLIQAFAYTVLTRKPWITIKRAFDKNGSMIPPPGQKTFTSPDSLRLTHRLRKKADAIITGSGTILADNPLFTVRQVLDHVGKRRWLAILDRRGRVPGDWLTAAYGQRLDAFIYKSIEQAVADLTAKGVQDILVEAGPVVSQAMMDSRLWVMSVTIHQGDPDRIEVEFNPDVMIPFDTAKFNWDTFLPT